MRSAASSRAFWSWRMERIWGFASASGVVEAASFSVTLRMAKPSSSVTSSETSPASSLAISSCSFWARVRQS